MTPMKHRNATLRAHAALACATLALAALITGCEQHTTSPKTLTMEEALAETTRLADKVGWTVDTVRDVEPRTISDDNAGAAGASLPPIESYKLTVNPRRGGATTVAEICASSEKAGTGTDGWMNEVATAFNASGARTPRRPRSQNRREEGSLGHLPRILGKRALPARRLLPVERALGGNG